MSIVKKCETGISKTVLQLRTKFIGTNNFSKKFFEHYSDLLFFFSLFALILRRKNLKRIYGKFWRNVRSVKKYYIIFAMFRDFWDNIFRQIAMRIKNTNPITACNILQREWFNKDTFPNSWLPKNIKMTSAVGIIQVNWRVLVIGKSKKNTVWLSGKFRKIERIIYWSHKNMLKIIRIYCNIIMEYNQEKLLHSF